MNKGAAFTVFTGNVFLFLGSSIEFFKFGTQLLAFLASGVSLTMILYKDRETVKEIWTGAKKVVRRRKAKP